MASQEEQAHRIQAAIQTILLHEWDPIGVANEPNARDEYDSYVGGVYRLLASGAPAEAVAAHLAQLEATEMGLAPGAPEVLLPVARRLCALDVRLRPPGPAT